MMKKITFSILLFTAFNFSYGQTKIAELTFESPDGYSTSITEFTDIAISSGEDYFIRTDGSNITGESFSNIQGTYYFTAQDLDGEGASSQQSLLINNINISGYSSLEFRVHIAEDDIGASQHWDDSDFLHFNYDLDNSGIFSDLLWVEGTGGTNTEPQIDTNFDGTGDGATISDTFTQFTQSIVGTGSLLDIQIVFDFNAIGEDIAIDNIEIWGILDPCGTAVTWDGFAWSNVSGPDITTPAILNGDYTTLGSIGSFSACSLTLNNADLLIADNTYIEVQNDITIDASSSIGVEPYGAIVQKNDLSSVTNSGGSITVSKRTAPMNAWYEYTYWSSPVSGQTVSGALTSSPTNRRFIFNGQNFLDATAETNNDDTAIGGQDNIDDNGDDWQLVSGATIMQAGVGYAATLTGFAYDTAPGVSNKQFRHTFTGDFNNGIVTVPIYRNDSELLDYNWNFVGNPYPSAIDADLFLAANSNVATDIVTPKSINGAIFLWSQNTPPSSTTNGNQTFNFSNNDFAIINAVGESAGGDGVTPSRFIPSGQGFFISMSNSASASLVSGDIYTTNVTFSNSMRVNGATDNSQFFKNTNTKSKTNTIVANKLWMNLTSDNGIFNQILVGYVNGATNDDDGVSYDTTKFAAKGTALYSIIEGSSKKFAIQGKAANSLDSDEIIKLGFKTSIEVATLYKLSVAQLQGDFLTNNTIYLKDNLLNKLHDLSASDYTFTSEVGEFNDRFEIVFNAAALSTNDVSIEENQFSIIDLDNDKVQFNTNNSLNIKTIRVYDLIGRQLYYLKGASSSETYRLSNLNNSIYIAKVELSNGLVITKKAIK
ncbi:T9SS type A sorting domain-containing protein [Flavivirga aquimarina]|uniref:T9SS type A sorting domain-containing protein n=1 Tax=Flavivirga aquimarina TaxID=2027862 RepID=A0ABT8WEE6_9FLAO|nr:T9SS type A sorting domain-containing protein [Flavivirga aquimarina]MDO5971533.1 T9SS type A sorting domain-containing protein [Flavivirga aquimarina]